MVLVETMDVVIVSPRAMSEAATRISRCPIRPINICRREKTARPRQNEVPNRRTVWRRRRTASWLSVRPEGPCALER